MIPFDSIEAQQLFIAELHRVAPETLTLGELETVSKDIHRGLTEKNLSPTQRQALLGLNVAVNDCRRQLAPSSSNDFSRMSEQHLGALHQGLKAQTERELQDAQLLGHEQRIKTAELRLASLNNAERARAGQPFERFPETEKEKARASGGNVEIIRKEGDAPLFGIDYAKVDNDAP